MNIGPWELVLIFLNIAIVVIPIIIIVWLVKTLKRIENHLIEIEASLSRMEKS